MKEWKRSLYLMRRIRNSKNRLKEGLKNLKQASYEWDFEKISTETTA